ncbi:MAG: CinA family nicotinamide mononucleotide deamidase-related protein [Planctomycetia bacterium]|nr:CinA family nicotinamide mononucleotide deamidase-related protein [Planctomycetia bacterium]
MHAEIIAIGTELTTGAKLDTNSQWLSIELAAVGIPVLLHTTVADDMPAMLETLRAAVRRSDIVLISGGLGPTLDDLTRQLLADLAGVELVLHEPSLRHVREIFAKRKRVMPERNTIQAMFPAGSEPIENPHGTAPGIWFDLPRSDGSICRIAAMPGVPSEMKPMFRDRVLPRLPRSDKVIRRARVNCYGVGESACEEKLGDVTARGRDPEVGITVHEGTITLRIEAHGASQSECDGKIAKDKQLIRERLGALVFGEEDEQLENIVVRELNRCGKTVSIADEVTGGVPSCWLTAIGQSEQCFAGGLIVGHVSNLPQRLSSEHVENVFHDGSPTDSAARARWLAESTRERFGTDFALSIAGSLRMSGTGSDEIPRLYLAVADASGTEVEEHIPVADISFARNRAAKSALDILRLRLQK